MRETHPEVPMSRHSLLLIATLVLAASLPAETTVFRIDPSPGPSFITQDYLALPGNSSVLPERMDSAQLGGTGRTLARVDVHLLLFAFDEGASADIQVKLFTNFDANSGTFVGEVWASDILANQAIGPSPTLYAFSPATPDILLPDILYYGVVMSNFQGFVASVGPVLGSEGASPTSDEAPPPAIPSTSFWVLNADNSTYTEVNNAPNTAVSVTIVAIPEPGTFGILSVGVLLLGLLHRARNPRA